MGADLDANVLVTETCGARSLTQRLGRLNRLGRYADAEAVLIQSSPGKNGWPVYGTEPETVFARLRAAAESGEPIDVSPARVAGVVGSPGDDPGRAPKWREDCSGNG
ncbi:MAG: hypothetical protein R2705_11535 [Ilumatobacteraceae bacterium]